MTSRGSASTDDHKDELTGITFVVSVCPECRLLHIGPSVPWHAFNCSEPELVRMVAQIQGRVT